MCQNSFFVALSSLWRYGNHIAISIKISGPLLQTKVVVTSTTLQKLQPRIKVKLLKYILNSYGHKLRCLNIYWIAMGQ